jgi:putative hydrolase of the HAD superfamily
MTNIKAILFDADGVIQKRPKGWRDSLPASLGFDGDPNVLIAALFEAEISALDGRSDFVEILPTLLARLNCRTTMDNALREWTNLEVDSTMVDVVKTLRGIGTACYLASNQERYRAAYMSEELGYRDLFDKEFYSCGLGTQKPLEAYFHTILKEIEVAPNNVLFIDDHQVNVEAARSVGLHAAVFSLQMGDEIPSVLREFGVRLP